MKRSVIRGGCGLNLTLSRITLRFIRAAGCPRNRQNNVLTLKGLLGIMRGFVKSIFKAMGEVSMYAVIKTGGKQYRVEAGEKLKIESIVADIGAELTISQVLMVAEGDAISVGKPMLLGATVKATVVSQGRHDKVRIFKMRRRKHYQKHQGHRQNYTEIQITGISAS